MSMLMAAHPRPRSIIRVVKTLKSHLPNTVIYALHAITNAFGESIHSKIEKGKRVACG